MTDTTHLTIEWINALDEKLSRRAVNLGYVNIDNMRALIAHSRATMQREKRLRGALKELVTLKDWKDRDHSPPREYYVREPKAWKTAKAALAVNLPNRNE